MPWSAGSRAQPDQHGQDRRAAAGLVVATARPLAGAIVYAGTTVGRQTMIATRLCPRAVRHRRLCDRRTA